MKILFLISLFLSLSFLTLSQTKYIVKIKTLDNHVHKGLLFQVKNEGVLVFPNKFRWDYKVMENNISKTKLINFGTIKTIRIKKKYAIPYGAIIGFFVGTSVGVLTAKKRSGTPNDLIGLDTGLDRVTTFAMSITGGALLGSSIDLIYPHLYNVKNDSVSIQNLKTKLKKYEFYSVDEGTLKDTNNH